MATGAALANGAGAGESAGGEVRASVPGGEVVFEPGVPKPEDIFLLARQQNFAVALKLLDAHPQHWTSRDDDGHSLLHWGALVGSKDFVMCALAKGVPVDAQAGNRQTPLMWAVLRGHVQVARILLDAKANIQNKDSMGATPLMIAIQHRNIQSLLLLMKRGNKDSLSADADKNGCTAGHWAAYKGDLTALKLLDYFDADLQSLDNSKMLPLHRAVCASQSHVIEFLVEKRSDPLARTAEGKSCLDLAEDAQDAQMQAQLKKLVKKPSNGKYVEDHDAERGRMLKDEQESKPSEGMFKTLMKDKAMHKFFPVFWLVCVSLAIFEYLMDMRDTSYEVAPRTALLFELCVPLSLSLFALVALMDPGKLPAGAKGRSGVEELMRRLDHDAHTDHQQAPDVSRLCTTTWVLKDLRTKYCAQTGACVEEFDHYCVWLNTAIGKRNHRQFVGLACVEWCTQLVHIYLLWSMALALVTYNTFGSWLLTVITSYPLLVILAAIQLLTAPWVLMLLLHQLRLIGMNLTTNEAMNAHRYEHFWALNPVMPGRMQKSYRNPFNKGGRIQNWLDFWWYRRRSDIVTHQEGGGCQTGGCKHCH